MFLNSKILWRYLDILLNQIGYRIHAAANKQYDSQYDSRFRCYLYGKQSFSKSLTASLLAGSLCVLLPTMSLAADPDEAVREQQHIWQDKIKTQRIDNLQQPQPQQDEKTPTATTTTRLGNRQTSDNKVLANNDSCLPFARIELAELHFLNNAIVSKLYKQAEQIAQHTATNAPCISSVKANALARAITKAYLDAGYFKISIIPETRSSNVSFWRIHVATIHSIENQTQLSTQRLFGNMVGAPANIAWLDQAVSNGERLIDGKLLLDVYPVGDDVRIKVSKQGDLETLSADVEWRYDPEENNGHNQIKLHATLRNILGQADLTSLTLQQTLSDEFSYDRDNQRQSASLYSIIPNGRWQWSLLLATNKSNNTIALPNVALAQTGESLQANLRSDFTLNRSQDSITTLYGQLAHQEVKSEILGSRLDTQSPTLTSGRIGISHTQLFNHSSPDNPQRKVAGAWVLDLSAEKAFAIHDNPATIAGLSDDYLRLLLAGYLTHQHSLVVDENPVGYWQMTHEVEGQYSNEDLFGITRQSLGSAYSGVRGIANAYNAASSGITLRNTLSYEPPTSSWPELGPFKLQWSPYVGIDYGIIKFADNYIGEDSSDAFSGTIGLKLTSYDHDGPSSNKRWFFDISASRAHVDYPNQNMHETLDTEISAVWRWQWNF